MTTSVLRTSAPAKVNLGLGITSRRADGFHELRSVFLRLRLADQVVMTGTDGVGDTLVVEGDPACPVEGNLVLRACAAFRAAAGPLRVGSMDIRVRKHIPMEAGMAGGSSDAAAILRLLTRVHPGVVGDAPLVALARSLGSDVPFFLGAAGAALVRGDGHMVESLPPPIGPVGVVLVKAGPGLSTGRVFGAWDALQDAGRGTSGDPTIIDRLAAELRAGATPDTIVGLAHGLRDANDLWPAAVMVEPRMAACRMALEDHLGRAVLMTGSGSTLFALYPDAAGAETAARGLVRRPPRGLEDAWVAASASGTPYPPDVIIEEGP